MTHEEKIEWMAIWCAKNNLKLELNGTCGFGRECVGVTYHETYPDYTWKNSEYDRTDNNGDVWRPEDAYHKHDCVAVLGVGKNAECQLYEWLKWFDNNNFKFEASTNYSYTGDFVDRFLGRNMNKRMVRHEVVN